MADQPPRAPRDQWARTHESELDEARMPVWNHLEELRKRLIWSVLVLAAGTGIAYNWAEQLVLFLERPLLRALPEGQQTLYFTGIADKFVTYLKVSALAAVAASAPFLLYQIWRFIAPGLYSKERKAVTPFLVFASLAFYVGLAFAYSVVLPTGYQFLVQFGGTQEKALITITEYFSMTLKLLFGVGLVFEVPVAILILVRLGIIDAALLRKHRKHAILVNAMVAAVLTPTPDAATMLLVAVPLHLLYELALFLATWFTPNKMTSQPA